MDKGAVEEIKKGQVPVVMSVKLEKETGDPILFAPPGWTAVGVKKYLDEYLDKPERVKGTFTAENPDSFIAATNRFKNAESAVFYTAKLSDDDIEASFLSVLNYHPKGGDDKKAEWADHRVFYNLDVSPELQTWLGQNAESMGQAEFAAFIEDNAADLAFCSDANTLSIKLDNIKPVFAEPSAMIMLSRGIEVRQNENYVSAYRAENGTMNMQFTTQHEGADGKPLNVPQWFVLQVRVFTDGPVYLVPVRLRYRAQSGKVSWFFEIYRLRDILDKALSDMIEKVGKETELPIFKGKPE